MKNNETKTAYEKEFERYSIKLQKRIKELRLENTLSQEDLMQYELSLRTVQRIEKEGTPANMTVFTLYKIAKAFKMKPHELLDL